MKPGPVSGSCGTAAYRSNRVISRDVQNDPLWEPFKAFAAQYGIASAWSSPLKDAKGALLGVFGMYYGDCREPSPQDLELVDHFVHLASIAVERYRYDTERERRATHDALTGLGNRLKLQAYAESITERPAEAAQTRSVVLFDLDHFKLHNDTLGQRASDQLLARAADRLRATLDAPGQLVRFGGDQFVAVIDEAVGAAEAQAHRVLQAFEAPVDLGDTQVALSVSAGVVEWTAAAADLDEALSQAIEAVEVAKRLGRQRCVVFGDTERAKLAGQRLVARALAEALDEDRVQPFLQPIVRLETGAPIGFEMLARLAGPTASGISPSVFIPIAEESSLIDRLGLSVLRSAFRTLAEHPKEFGHLLLSVNVSIRQLLREGLARKASSLAAEFGVQPDRILLEVTESHWLDVDSPARGALLDLKAAGFRLALDDFGSGKTTLSHLRTIPFDMVKIDRSFTTDLMTGLRGRALCDAALTMATACGMQVLAEGVETPEQATSLLGMGYQFGQGYLWAKPMPLAQAREWLKAPKTATTAFRQASGSR
jgi:diguanylate cyclase (GGDEF)-like protein